MTRAGHLILLAGLGLGACSTETPGDAPARGAGGFAGAVSGGSGGSGAVAATAGGSQNAAGAGGGAAGAAAGAATGGSRGAGCDTPGLVWKTARKTWYTSYPDPGSPECIEYNGCMWAGMFSACNDKKPEAWVQAHNIVAAFPDFDTLELHDLCLKSGDKSIVVTVLDTCADSDCDGCCTQNQGDNEQLIDLESYTNARWGVDEGQIAWADLGPTAGDGCD